MIALDKDPIAVFVARDICRLNGSAIRLLAGGIATIRSSSSKGIFDVVLANILPARLRSDFQSLFDALRGGGVLVLSGILRGQAPDLEGELALLGLTLRSRKFRQEWVALEFVKEAM